MSERNFTAEEANALIPEIGPMLEELRVAQGIVAERHDELSDHAGGNGGGAEGAEFLNALNAAGRIVRALEHLGIVVRDPSTGLIDFPSERDGEPVYLCWRLGEDRVEWWHPTTSGFADRRPL